MGQSCFVNESNYETISINRTQKAKGKRSEDDFRFVQVHQEKNKVPTFCLLPSVATV
jgi:hypothetical protein